MPEVNSLHNDLDIIIKWSNDWLMPFSTNKCKTLHIGYSNPNLSHNLEPGKIKVIDGGKDTRKVIS